MEGGEEMNRLLIVQGKSQYGFLQAHNKAMRKEFEALGWQVDELDLTRNQPAKYVREVLARPYDLCWNIGAISAEAKIDGHKNGLFADLDYPVILQFVDHPRHWLNRIKCAGKAIVACVDRDHCRWLSKNYPEIKTMFLPLAGIDSGFVAQTRLYDICFFGTVGDPDKLGMPDKYLPLARELAAQNPVPLDNHDIDDNDFPLVDHYIRLARRNIVLKKFWGSGYRLLCFGNGYAELPFKHEHYVFGSIDYEGFALHCAQSKVVLNIGPGFTDGPVDRLLTAAANGAKVISESHPYARHEMDGVVHTFNMNCIEHAMLLCSPLHNFEPRPLIGHSWKDRVQQALQMVQSKTCSP